ncbi:MAG TPA: hypothetical protein VFV20_10625, partial [Candidatus Limnocylindria bacterium]|nr:hypothetical protein [Candidatus Limnocylindria bacterium]
DASGNVVVPDGVRTRLPRDVAPGTTITVDLSVVVPPSVGTHVLRVDLFREGIGWFSLRGVRPADVEVTIEAPHAAAYGPLTASVWLTLPSAAPLVVTLKNTGTTAWEAGGPNPVRLSYHWMRNGQLALWDGARAALAKDVLPGETVIVELPVIPPEGLSAHTLRLDLVKEGVRWFSDEGVATRDVSYTVASGYGAAYGVASPSAAGAPLTVTLTNTGVRPWVAAGPHPVRLAYHLLRDGAVVVWDGPRIPLGRDVQPGERVTLQLPVAMPATNGSYAMRLDLVEEGVRWFSDAGIAGRDVPVPAD